MPKMDPQIPSVDLGRRAADTLARDIIVGRFPPESILPKEMALVEHLGISRPTLRSGLQMLETVGMITRVSGHGTFVRPYADWSFLSPLLSRWVADYSPPRPPFLRDLFAFRLSIEPVIAMVAARNARGKDLQDMEEAFAGMTAHGLDPLDPDCVSSPFDDYDLAFHQAIYRATRNLIWTQMIPVIEPALRLVIHQSNADAGELKDSLGRHGALLTCIRRQDAAGAHAAGLSLLLRTASDLGISLEPIPTTQAYVLVNNGSDPR
ncbi:FadR/GntR family transcriptional regulator [Telmatospirillum siberiense]|nr:FCD domain-containing protein [Telmatospirillum siberiense]